MPVPTNPKIYHIVHVDRLSSIIDDGCLWCDAEVIQRNLPGTVIGMSNIKERRLQLSLVSHTGLHVGDCVPFYFCPRSIMLYVIYQANHPDIIYRDGQNLIVHLEADMRRAVAWAEEHNQRWAFTTSNAGSSFFDDYCDLGQVNRIDWKAVQAKEWEYHKDGKQAEFLLESAFPWHLIERIGVYSPIVRQRVANKLPTNDHRPPVEVIQSWYY